MLCNKGNWFVCCLSQLVLMLQQRLDNTNILWGGSMLLWRSSNICTTPGSIDVRKFPRRCHLNFCLNLDHCCFFSPSLYSGSKLYGVTENSPPDAIMEAFDNAVMSLIPMKHFGIEHGGVREIFGQK